MVGIVGSSGASDPLAIIIMSCRQGFKLSTYSHWPDALAQSEFLPAILTLRAAVVAFICVESSILACALRRLMVGDIASGFFIFSLIPGRFGNAARVI